MEELVTTIGKQTIPLLINFEYGKISFSISSGVGTFSRVILTRRCTQECEEYHALKVMAIRDIIRLKQVNHINNERMILADVQHPSIVRL